MRRVSFASSTDRCDTLLRRGSGCERVGREGLVELDRLGLAQEVLRHLIRVLIQHVQSTQGGTSLFVLTQVVLGQSQEGQVARSLLLVQFV
jgi:hypothetical protein